jgi:hypothetical protein
MYNNIKIKQTARAERRLKIMNRELIKERVNDLETYIVNFPDSPLVRIHQNELNYLKAILNYKSREEIEQLKSLL